jgi:type I restriction enzyme, S subunit
LNKGSLEKVDAIFKIQYGSGLPKNQRNKGDFPVYGSNGIIGYHTEAITRGPTIIIGRKGSIGEVSWSDEACWPIDTTYYIDELKIKGHLKYFYYFLRALNLPRLDKSSAIPGLDREDVYPLKIFIPPSIENQILIAQEMERTFTEIKKVNLEMRRQKEAIATLKYAILRTSFESLANEKSNLTKLSKIANITMGQSPKGASYNKNNQGVPLLNGPTEFGETYPIPIQWTTSPKKLCKTGDLLLCVRGNTAGKMNWADQQYCLGRGISGINGIEEKGDIHFIKYALENKINELLSGATRSTFPNLDRDTLQSLKIFAPDDLSFQKEVAEKIKMQLDVLKQISAVIDSQMIIINLLPDAIFREILNYKGDKVQENV